MKKSAPQLITTTIINQVTEGMRAIHRQAQGMASLLILLISLMLGGMLLYATSQQLSQYSAQDRALSHYFQAWLYAQSSLHWGLQQTWPRQSGWSCQQDITDGLVCCLWQERDQSWLRAQSPQQPLVVWQRVVREPDDEQTWRLHAKKNGWIDSCPFSQASKCQLPTGLFNDGSISSDSVI